MLIIRLLISLLLSPNNYARVSGPDMVDDVRDHRREQVRVRSASMTVDRCSKRGTEQEAS